MQSPRFCTGGQSLLGPNPRSELKWTLSLKTNDRIDRALSLLKNLDMDAVFHKSMQTGTSSNDEYSPSSMSHIYQAPKKLLVSLTGIAHSNHLHDDHRLYIPVIDRGGGLRAFIQEIRSRFISSGLMVGIPIERLRPVPMHIMVLGNNCIRSKTVNTKPSVQRKLVKNKVLKLLAGFDLRNLYEDFRTFPWTHCFALERLSLSKMDLSDLLKDNRVIGRGFQEVACVPLPGIDRLEKQEELEGIIFVRPKIVYV